MSELRQGLAATLLVVVSSVAVLAVTELTLRILFPERLRPTPDYLTLEPDPYLGYRLRQSVAATFARTAANGGDRIRWRTNSHGYRGPELRDGLPRVVIYGDSNIQAAFSRDEATLPAQLEAMLSTAGGQPVEVINGGVLGYGPDHYLLKMTADLPQLRPDVVIWNLFADNDLGDPVRHRLLEVRDGVLVTRDDHFVYPARSLTERLQGFASSLLLTRAGLKLISLIRPAASRSAESAGEDGVTRSGTLDERLMEIQRLIDISLQRYRDRGPDHVRIDHYDLDVATDPAGDSARLKQDLLGVILAEARARAAQAGVPLFVLVQPSRIDLTTTEEMNYLSLAARFPGYDRRRLSAVMEESARAAGLEVVSLYEVFLAAGPATLYFDESDNHWNDAGQQLAARTIAPHVLRHLGHPDGP